MERAREASRAAARGRATARDTAAPGPGGTLTLAAAPIGRPQDASPRLAAALAAAPVVAAEDTHRVRRLASALGVRMTGRVISYWDEVEAARVPPLLAELTAGRDVLLITDAGMPGISDPGYRLVAAAAAAGSPVPPRSPRRSRSPGCPATGSASRASRRAGGIAGRAGSPSWPASRGRWSSSSHGAGWPRRWPRWPRRSVPAGPRWCAAS
jgi:Tetrapyrrole (Corrin/Porphyrin) Methylases